MKLDYTKYWQEIKEGDQQAFEVVFKGMYADLCRYAHSFLKDKDDAEDLVQNTFVKVWDKRDQIELSDSLSGYLYRMVYNQSMNKIKHQNIRLEHVEHVKHQFDEGEFVIDNAQNLNEMHERVHLAIDKLPKECGRIFKMSRFEELKYQEIADTLEISIKTVENQIGKALKIMRTELSEYLVGLLIFIQF